MMERDPYIYLAAHDLRAPLLSVKGILSLMKQDSERQNFEHYLSLLERSVDNMNQSISDIITHSKNGKVKIKPQEVDFKNIAEESIQSLSFMKGAESVRINLSAEEGGTFFSDPARLVSIFSNIISNAIRYRDDRKISFLSIDVTFTRDGCQTIFQDNGIGIDEELQNKVFDKFFVAIHEHEGSGLGLYLAKKSIEKLGGKIHMRSKLGEGTIFIIQIPNALAQINH